MITNKEMIVVAFSVLGLGAASVQAGDLGEAHTRAVSYADLNLDSTQGAKVLIDRVKGAAEQVCAPLDNGRFSPAYQTCVDHAVTSALATVRNDNVNALYHTKKPTAAPALASLR